MKILSAFTHSHVVPNLYEFLSSVDHIKGIVHFESNFWYVLAYLKGIQDVGVFVSASSFNFDILGSNRSCLSVI